MSEHSMKFIDPPKRPRMSRWSYDWIAVRRQLVSRPNEWAVLDENGKTSIATAIRGGKITGMKPIDGIEVTQTHTNRSVKPNTCSIYLRYTPEKDTNKENRGTD